MEAIITRMETGELRQFISFSVGDEEYGLELLRVKEVIRVREITWLPRAPAFVKGIINLRGDVIPIVDLREKFGLEAVGETAQTRVIVVEMGGQLVGMVVDSASQVVRIPAAQIDPPPPVLGGFSQELITGVGKLEDTLVVLLNVDSLLTSEERSALSAISASGPGSAAGR
ncbi:MAG TPA: chemotaxis protein CheW [Spirochaetia bacterium]|nr:chemotaxis protein CheW [Spirochaetia bacterium]